MGAQLKVPSAGNWLRNVDFTFNQRQSFFILLNWLGYVILLGSIVNYLWIIYPPQLLNPQWELQTINRLVDHAWFLLIAVVLIFLPTRSYIRRIELSVLKGLRWGILLMAILFILMLPLGLINAQRIDQTQQRQLELQQQAQLERLSNLERTIRDEGISQQQLEQLQQQFAQDELAVTEEQVKTVILEGIQQERENLREQVQQARQEQVEQLVRRTLRTEIGGLLIGVFLIRLWFRTNWVKTLTYLLYYS